MKQNSLKELKRIVGRIESGIFSVSDVSHLLIILWPTTPKKTSLKDIEDFIAHSDIRDRGILQEEAEGFIEKFIDWLGQGGQIKIAPPPYSQKEILEQMCKQLKQESIYFNSGRIKAQYFKIMVAILEIVAETKLVIKSPGIKDCYLSPVEDQPDGSKSVFLAFSPVPMQNHNLKIGTVRTPALIAKPVI